MTSPDRPTPTLDGGCACGQVRYRLLSTPMFVHCCHCTRCQRETGTPFAHHAMIEFSRFEVLQGAAHFLRVPTDSGGVHWVARCPACQTAMWNEHGARPAVTLYVRVGTLDTPQALPPQAHIYVRSRQAWLRLDDSVPSYRGAYDAARLWPADSLARYQAARALRSQRLAADKALAAAQDTGRSTRRTAARAGGPRTRPAPADDA